MEKMASIIIKPTIIFAYKKLPLTGKLVDSREEYFESISEADFNDVLDKELFEYR